MLVWMPPLLKGVIVMLGMAVNTVILVTLLVTVALFKLMIPVDFWIKLMTRLIIWIAELWMSINNALQRLTQKTVWEVQGMEDLQHAGWYFVVSNHQGWSDILVLQRLFNRRIPMLKFFLKQQLIWVPFLGMAWWALDFPFMQRFSRDYLQKHPEQAGKDLLATQKACEKFRYVPVSVMNFMEGTRFTPAKHQAQKSPYTHLLRPKAGGASFVLSAMGGRIHSMINVTLFYPDNRTSFWDFVCGRIERIVVRVDKVTLPPDILQGDYENDPAFRQHFQAWVNQLWSEKDQLLTRLKAEYSLTETA